MDANGELVNAFQSVSDAEADDAVEIVEDMALNEVRFIEQTALTVKPGINRFHWDMRYRGPWQEKEKGRFGGGALVAPGDYSVRLTVGEESFTQPLSIVVDPRVLKTGVSEADIADQIALERKVLTLLDQARRTAHKLDQELEALAETDAARRETLEAAIARLVTEEGTYMPPRLISQISYLSRMLDNADQAPGNEAIARYDELKAEYEAILAAI
jgi:hypothetical protein